MIDELLSRQMRPTIAAWWPMNGLKVCFNFNIVPSLVWGIVVGISMRSLPSVGCEIVNETSY